MAPSAHKHLSTDIFEAKEGQAGLEHLRLLISNTDEIYILIDPSFRILAATPVTHQKAWMRLGTNLTPGTPILDEMPESHRSALESNYRRVFAGEDIVTDDAIQTVEGQTIYYRVHYKPVRDDNGRVTAALITTTNTTPQKKAEEMLRKDVERWQFALEGSNQGLWDWNIQTGEVFYSKSWKEILGYRDDEVEDRLEEWEIRVHPDDKAQTLGNIEQHLSSANPFYESTYRLKAKDGSYRWILARGLLVERTPDGRPLRMLGTHTDVTEKKNTEDNYKLLFYSSPLPMYTLDLETSRFLDVNDAAVHHYGYTRQEFLSLHLHQIKLPEDLEELARLMNADHQASTFTHKAVRHRKKNGEIIWMNITGHVLERDGRKIALILAEDITEKLKADEKLRQSEIQYRTLFQHNPLPSCIYDLDTLQFLEVNEAAIAQYGYTWQEFLQLTVPDIFHIEHRAMLVENAKTDRHKHTVSATKLRHLKKNGESMYVDIIGNMITYNNREARLVIIHDITAKVLAEEKLTQSNQRFVLVARATSDAIYDWDLSTRQLYWGEGLQTLFGYQPHELPINKWEEYVHPEDRKEVSQNLYDTIFRSTSKFWNKEYRFKKSDGTYSHVIEKGFIVRDKDDKPLRMIGAMQDNTEHKRKEQELLEGKERFEAVLKATHDLIWDWNLENGSFYRDTEGMHKVYGVQDPSLIENIYSWLQRIHPDDQLRVQQVINKILHATHQDNFDVEYRFKRQDGTYTYVYDRGILLRNAEGKPVRMIGAAQDITDRKRLEQQLLQKELEKQKIISKATIDAQEKERSEIGKELHDNVNQVLTTTKLYLELSQSNPDLKDELVQKSAKNIMYVINEIRQLSRSLMNPSIGDLGLVDSINDLVESINATRKVEVLFSGNKEVEKDLSDSLKLMVFRIIQEALNNAIKHAHAKTVLISIKKNSDKMELIIRDDGIGFDTDSTKKGTGLKNIQNRVYLANGSLKIQAAPMKGCKMIIRFPYNNHQ